METYLSESQFWVNYGSDHKAAWTSESALSRSTQSSVCLIIWYSTVFRVFATAWPYSRWVVCSCCDIKLNTSVVATNGAEQLLEFVPCSEQLLKFVRCSVLNWSLLMSWMLKTLMCTLLYRGEGKMVVLACQGAYSIHPVTSALSNYQTIYWLCAHNLLCMYAVIWRLVLLRISRLWHVWLWFAPAFLAYCYAQRVSLITWSTCCLSSKWRQVE